MSASFAFGPQGLTFNITTNATPATASAQTIQFVAGTTATFAGLTQCPAQVRIVNTGTAIVYVSVTSVARVAVVPTASVPSQEYPILPNEDVVFTLNAQPQPSQTSNVNLSLFINTISASAAQVLNVTFGEGM